MRKAKKILKYTAIFIIGVTLVLVLVTTNFIFSNKAPIVSGEIEYGIVYKNGLALDIYQPTKNVFEKSPIIVYVHGGAWIRGTKTAINFNRFNGAINTLRDQGYTIICPDYSLAGEGRSVFPACILDIYDAIEWTKENASRYSLDTANIGLLGESAGAHIAMMIAFPDTTLQPAKYPKTNFNYLIDVYGPNDLTDIYHGKALETIDVSLRKVSRIFGSEFNIKEYVFGFDPNKDSVRATALMHQYSPINIVTKRETPVLIIHGRNDRIVPVQQSITLKSKLDSLTIPNEIYLMDSVDHSFIYATREQRDSVQLLITNFVVKNYKQ